MRSTSLRKVAVVAASTLVLTGTLAACSGNDSGGSDGGVVTLNVWARDGDNSLSKQVSAFEKTHPKIKVKVSLVNNDQYLTKFANSIRAKSAPDLIDFDIINAPLLSTQGQLLDITDKAKGLSNYDSLAKAGVDIGTLDDKVYSLPVALTASQMVWNKELFTKAGLDPNKAPASLAEVKEDAKKIQALGGGITGFTTIGGTGQAFTGYPSGWADGGTIFTKAGPSQKATFTSKPMENMVAWYQDMWKSGLMQKTDEPNQDPGNVGSQNVLAGKVGIIFTGANVFSGHEKDFGSAAGIPGASGKLSSFAGGNQAAIPLGSKHPDQAWELLEWLVTDKEAAQINGTAGWIAPDLTLAESLATNEWAKNTVGALKVGQLPKSIAYFAVVNDPNGPWAQNSQAAIFQGADVHASLAKGEKQADQLIKDAYTQVAQ